MKNIFRFFKTRDWVYSILSAGLILAQVFFEMMIPEYISKVSSMVEVPEVRVTDIVRVGSVMFILAFISMALSVLTAYLIAKISAATSERMRNAVFEKTMEFSAGEVGIISSSSLITRCTGDVAVVQMLVVTGLQVLVKAPFTAVMGIVKISSADYRLTLAALISVTLIVGLMVWIVFVTTPMSVRLQTLTDSINRESKEHISGIQVIRAFLSADFHQKRFQDVNEEIRDIGIRLNRIMAFLSPGLYLVLNLLNLAMVIIGALLINDSELASRQEYLSSILTFSSYALLIVSAFITLVQIFMLLPRAITSLNRISEVIDSETAIKDGKGIGEAVDTDIAVEFKNVDFQYPGSSAPVLSDLNFSIKKGETVAFIGATGSGKTSVVNLIPRLYEATKGSILVNGVDVKDYPVKQLRNLIGYVPQKSFLFTGTIAGNIDYGDNGKMAATLNEIKKAAEIGQAREFIELKEGQYQAPVAAGGSNFSGGQRQRLTISRAVCRDPEIYIFDDSFSALDFKTDRILREKLKENAGNATVIIVAQRIGTIRNADRIIVLENGRVVGNGNHDELMKACDVYREIALTQFSEKEVMGA